MFQVSPCDNCVLKLIKIAACKQSFCSVYVDIAGQVVFIFGYQSSYAYMVTITSAF